MITIRKNSNEYFFAKSKAINALFFSMYNQGMYEVGRVSSEWWTNSTTLFRDGICYVLKDSTGNYHRWSV